MRERQLLKLIGERDESALSELYGLYQPRLARFLSRFTDSEQAIEEVVNDALLVVWESCLKFRGDSSPSTWIMGIAYNKMLKSLKRNHSAVPTIPAHEVTLEAESRGSDAMDIVSALRRLPRQQAAVVVLTYEFGYSYREIGEILDCPENTVKTRMFHARKSLKRILEAQS